MRSILVLFLLICLSIPLHAQEFFLGANRPDVSWQQLSTEHFTLIYHEGVDSIAREAANVAEAVYPIVTGNLQTEIPGRTLIYLSDLDDIPNAFALDDHHIFIWLRGLLDDMPLGGIRSSGHAKWLRTVITHEFTHIVIAHATKSWMNIIFPGGTVPRWFNEGTARFMEPDGWTTDLDEVLRVAAVNGRLDYTGLARLDGYLLYETGHSLVRYITWRFGDTAVACILKGGRTGLGEYNFEDAVKQVTGKSMTDIYNDWFRMVTVLYGANYAVHEETGDISPALTDKLEIISSVRYAPNSTSIALLGGDQGKPVNLYLVHVPASGLLDSSTVFRIISDEPGIDQDFSWSPDGRKIVLSKYRYASHRALLHDLYVLDVQSGDMERLTSDASLTDPAWSPDGNAILAVEKHCGRDQLVLVDPRRGERKNLTHFSGDVQLYTPSWSPDGSRIAFSLFDEKGSRAIAVINRDGSGLVKLTQDSSNNRYPVWSPDGKRIAFTTHASGIPNIQVMNADGSDRHYSSDVAGGVYSVQWKPGSDSVVVISFDTRDRIAPHLIPASRMVIPVPAPTIRDKYSAWQHVSFSLRTPSADSVPSVKITAIESYSSVAHIHHLFTLPFLGSDISRTGSAQGLRGGIFSFWNDPMGIHSLSFLGDVGYASKQFGGQIGYVNNYFPISIEAAIDYLFGYAGTLQDVGYYQRRRGGSLFFSLLLPAPNTLTTHHFFAVGATHRRLEPWNAAQFADIESKPLEAALTEIIAGYGYSSRGFFFAGTYRRSEPAIGSDLQYTRLSAITAWKFPFPTWGSTALLARLEGSAQWGQQLPQEFIGLDKYDQIENGFNLANLSANLIALGSNYRVRGVRRYMYGDRVAVGSIGVLQPLVGDFLQSLFFAEAGAAWYAQQISIDNIQPQKGYGLELRLHLGDIALTSGIAFEMKSRAQRDFYLRIILGL